MTNHNHVVHEDDLFAGAAPGSVPDKRSLFKFIRQDAEADYWDGEA